MDPVRTEEVILNSATRRCVLASQGGSRRGCKTSQAKE